MLAKKRNSSLNLIPIEKDNPFKFRISRRVFFKTSLALLSIPLFTKCEEDAPIEFNLGNPKLSAVIKPPSQTPTTGLTQLGLGEDRDGILYVPQNYSPNKPMPLFVALHGASGDSSNWSNYLDRAEERGMILLAPDSRSLTWDFVYGTYGEDIEFLDKALKLVFDQCNIDSTHIVLAGFSDGASYALSLGLSNGDIFSHLIGYSPGFLDEIDPIIGKPKIYISHGTLDNVLNVESSRNAIVPELIHSGYDVYYNEFEGGHTVPKEITTEALDWFLDTV